MPSVYRTTAVWAGFPGSPGYTKFSWLSLTDDTSRNAAGAAMRAFFAAMTSYMQTAWTITVSPEVNEYDIVNGDLIGSYGMTTTPTVVTGIGGAGAYAGGAGACVTWRTGLIWNGHRVQGRTFLSPLLSGFDIDGSLVSSFITTMTTAGNALISASGADFAVWGRHWNRTGEHPVQDGGAVGSVVSVTIKDAASGLRSRRP